MSSYEQSGTEGCITAFWRCGSPEFNERNLSFLLNEQAGPVKETFTSPFFLALITIAQAYQIEPDAVAEVHFFNLSIIANAAILHIFTGKR